MEVVVDHDRHLYGAYGLGISSFWHVLNPWSMLRAFKLGREEGVWNRPTESGTRWQTAGTFAMSPQGIIKYSHLASAADDMIRVDEAVQALTS